MTPELRLRGLWLGVGLVLLAVLAIASLAPGQLDQPGYPQLDKVLHAGAYALVTGWFLQLFHGPRTALAVALGMLGYGFLLEVLQAFVPPREPSLLDLAANAAGVSLGVAVCSSCRHLLRTCERILTELVQR